MKQRLQKSALFIGKSMLWSLLLYIVLMLAFNWQEVSNSITGRNKITVVNNLQSEAQQPATNISVRPGVLFNVITMIKIIGGITSSHAGR
jgi:hypothetical protein